tara:strand:- start:15172 stop:15924 length:753 start_codon:yes stop_codon:yes gene_type:complete
MQTIMLAAGVGARLSNSDETYLPKCLLPFDGQSLLARHIDILRANGITKLTLVTGYREAEVKAELISLGAGDYVETVTNPQFRDGSIVSLGSASQTMRSGDDILFMDADVLCHPDLIQKLITSVADNAINYDTDFEPGDDPVKLCLKDGRIVDFSKKIDAEFDTIGEWPGFVKWSPAAARHIADFIDHKINQGSIDLIYEEAFRDYMLSPKVAQIDCLDITGLPWIEIDFPEDLERAHDEILPALKSYTR